MLGGLESLWVSCRQSMSGLRFDSSSALSSEIPSVLKVMIFMMEPRGYPFTTPGVACSVAIGLFRRSLESERGQFEKINRDTT